MPANPTEIKAPAVAPIVVSIVVLLGSNVASSPNCHAVENAKGIPSVAIAPTLMSAMLSAFLAATVVILRFLARFNLIPLTTPLPNLCHPRGINNNQGSAIIILTNSAPKSLGLALIILPTSFMSMDIGPSSKR